jgi:hypothetical protein
MEREHMYSPFAAVGFKCWGVFKSNHKTTAKYEWQYVCNNESKQVGKRDEGHDGWSLADFIERFGEDCVEIHAPVQVLGTGSIGTLHTSLHNNTSLQSSEQYIVIVDGRRIQFRGGNLRLVDASGMRANEWAKVHGKTARLKYKPVYITIDGNRKRKGQLLDQDVGFKDGKFAAGLALQAEHEYKVRVGKEILLILGSKLSYCTDKFERGTFYEIVTHDPAPVQTVDGAFLIWSDPVFRADLQRAEVVAGRLYTGRMSQ